MELSPKMLETREIAMREGIKYTAISSLLVAGAHFGLKQAKVAWYLSIPAAPKRILAVTIILGSFSAASHLSQAYHVLGENRKVR
jgi:hypothetical protein